MSLWGRSSSPPKDQMKRRTDFSMLKSEKPQGSEPRTPPERSSRTVSPALASPLCFYLLLGGARRKRTMFNSTSRNRPVFFEKTCWAEAGLTETTGEPEACELEVRGACITVTVRRAVDSGRCGFRSGGVLRRGLSTRREGASSFLGE